MKTEQGSELFHAIVATPFGAMGIRTQDERVRELVYLPPHYAEKDADDAVAAQAAEQIARYLLDPDFRFDLPLFEAGTAFQRKVWETIGAIPRGSVVGIMGQSGCGNWFPLIIPCHRVTASGGLGGFSNQDDENGFHLSVKRWLLRHEGATASPWQQQSIWP